MAMVLPPNKNMSQSASASAVRSPIVSPSHSNASHLTVVPSNRHHSHNSHGSWNQFPSISAYAMPRSHSHDEGDHSSHRDTKRLRHNSPNSTSPSSPTISHDSLPSTPERTPLVTPMHSPRLPPCCNNYNLPSIRDLLIPAITPVEPQFVDGQYCPNNQAASTPLPRSVISDIMLRTVGAERILPDPRAPLGSKENKDSSNIESEKSIDSITSIDTEMSSHLIKSSAPPNPASLQQYTSQYLHEQPPLQHNSPSPAVCDEETPNINIEHDGIKIDKMAKASFRKEKTGTCLQPPTKSNTNGRNLAHQETPGPASHKYGAPW